MNIKTEQLAIRPECHGLTEPILRN